MSYETFMFNGKEFKIDKYLANALVTLVYNVKNDWDFVILISGNREVRIGKSVLAMTVSAYIGYCLAKMKLNNNAFNVDNIFFDHKDMLKKSMEKPKYSVILYDEAREGLASQRASTAFQQDLIQFFNECGQLNHIYILVLADFFDMREVMAVGRSELLINCYKREVNRKIWFGEETRNVVFYDRGFFQFFNKRAKNLLYDFYRTTSRKNYSMVKTSFPVGCFENQYPVDEKQYRKLKEDALIRFRTAEEKAIEKKKPENKPLSPRYERISDQRNTVFRYLEKNKILTKKKICEITNMSLPAVSGIISGSNSRPKDLGIA